MQELTEEKEVIELEVDETLTKQMKFIGLFQQVVGILCIISGGFMCLTIIGAAAGVPYIMGAIKIFKSGGNMSDAAVTKSGFSLKEALANMSKGMKFMLIGMVVWIILYILFIFLYIIIIFIIVASEY
jgi:hypothetical protein